MKSGWSKIISAIGLGAVLVLAAYIAAHEPHFDFGLENFGLALLKGPVYRSWRLHWYDGKILTTTGWTPIVMDKDGYGWREGYRIIPKFTRAYYDSRNPQGDAFAVLGKLTIRTAEEITNAPVAYTNVLSSGIEAGPGVLFHTNATTNWIVVLSVTNSVTSISRWQALKIFLGIK